MRTIRELSLQIKLNGIVPTSKHNKLKNTESGNHVSAIPPAKQSKKIYLKLLFADIYFSLYFADYLVSKGCINLSVFASQINAFVERPVQSAVISTLYLLLPVVISEIDV